MYGWCEGPNFDTIVRRVWGFPFAVRAVSCISEAVDSIWIQFYIQTLHCGWYPLSIWAGISQSVWRLTKGLTVRGSNPGVGENFRTRPDRPCGPPSLLYDGYRVFTGGKAVGAWRWPPTPSSAEVKGRVELYLYFLCGPSFPVLGWTLLLPCAR